MIKVKEIKDDAIIQIPVSKGYYMMVKNLAFTLINNLMQQNKSDEYFQEVLSKPYVELDDDQRSLHTVSLLVAEIEAQANKNQLFIEKEILEPGDEGYVAPTED